MSSDDLDRRAFISAVMVGPCPRCGSHNTHDCFYDEEEHHPGVGECPLIKAIDDPIVGHCEECESVFCIECGKVIARNERSLSNIARLAEGHSKSCPELKPQRWAEKYGSTHRLVSVQDDMVTITEHAEELVPDGTEEDEANERTVTLHLSKEAGITSEQLRKKTGYYMKFSYDADEIHAVADLESDDDDDVSDASSP